MVLQGQIALVTGASRGIGQAIALEIGKQGATVIGTATSESGARAISTYLQAAGIKGAGMALNVNDVGQTEQMLGELRKQFGEIGILVTNAGITRDNLILRLSEEDWDLVLDINLKGAFLCTKAAARPMLKARAGRIINIASIVGQQGNAGQANYSASKGGLIALTKTCAREFSSRGVLVNAIAPGFIRTRMTEVITPEARERLMGSIPLGRMGEPEEIAKAALFLAGEQSSYMTGQVLGVNGGMFM